MSYVLNELATEPLMASINTGNREPALPEGVVQSDEVFDEILEAVWTARESGWETLEEVAPLIKTPVTVDTFKAAERQGLIVLQGEGIGLLPVGEARAEALIRKKRLAERLMVDVLGMDVGAIERAACEFEHVLTKGVEATICTLLGHPRKCPHGAAIPEGTCCRDSRSEVGNIVTTLDRVEVGQKVKIAYVSTEDHTVMHRLLAYGILPGSVVSVHQKSPTLVIQAGNLQLALDASIGKCISASRFW